MGWCSYYPFNWRGFSPESLILTINTFLSGISAEIIPGEYGENKVIQLPAGEWGIIPANTGRMNPPPQVPAGLDGSSPRIRGESPFGGEPQRGGGIIPANTGRIVQEFTLLVNFGDHPREYGENGNAQHPHGHPQGSSPRIRGEFLGA